jgi:NAD(P) transhydrogenase subunit alpha
MEQNQTIQELAAQSQEVTAKLMALANDSISSGLAGSDGFFMIGLTIFVLAAFVGYYVIWNVTPALHSPLMSVTNAISGVVIAGALVAAGVAEEGTAKWLGFVAVTLASINIFGGFAVTDRMLAMFKKK